MESCLKRLLPLLLLWILSTAAHAQFNYTAANGTITITGYTGPGGGVIIPGTIDGLPVTSIGSHAFTDCTSLISVTIPDSVTRIGEHAFYYCYGLTSVTIGNGVTDIADFTFACCPSLTSVTIPNSVISIGDGAFIFCTSLPSVTIPDSVTHIDDCAFFGCSSLTAITVDALNPVYSSVDGVLCDKSQTLLIRCPEGKAGSYLVPTSITRIGGAAFGNCRSLTSVTIPNRVTHIEAYTFSWCVRLRALYFLGNAPSLYGALGGRFYATVYYLPWTTGWGATYGCLPTALWNPVEGLIELVDGSAVRNPKPLMATLWAALGSVECGNLVTAANQLRAFQNKVRAQVADPALALQLIEPAQQVIDALQF